jgi:hypothetical protein
MRRLGPSFVTAIAVLAVGAGSASADTFEVDTAIDDPSLTPCSAAADDCSLRGAILNSNGTPAVDDVVNFEIPGAGPHTITLNAALPEITDTVAIDGYSDTGASANTQAAPTSAFSSDGLGSNAVLKIEIDMNDHGGIVISAGNTSLRGLSIYNLQEQFDPPGPPTNDFVISKGIELRTNGGNTIAGNFIGLTADGEAPADFEDWNKQHGIGVTSGDGNAIGGTAPADRNVISANGGSNGAGGIHVEGGANTRIQGNLIGTTPDGTDIPTIATPDGPVDANNGQRGGIQVNDFFPVGAAITNLLIGGTTAGTANVISGNTHDAASGAVEIDAPWTSPEAHVLGNRIGTDVTGTAVLGNNSLAGIGATAPVEIGDDQGHGNLISGNDTGVMIRGSGSTVEGNRMGTNRSGTTPLPNTRMGLALESQDSIVGGTSPGARNLISGNGVGIGTIFSGGVRDNDVQGNFIGTDITGTTAIGNTRGGIALAGGERITIGGAAAGTTNVIAGNGGPGIQLRPPEGPQNGPNEILGNKIGVNAAGAPLGNAGPGVHLINGFDNVIGRPAEGNTIANNSGDGVLVSGIDEASFGNSDLENDRNSIRGNSIFANGQLGIDLGEDVFDDTDDGDGVTQNDAGDGDTGNNALQNFPLVNAALPGASTFVRGFINSRPNTAYTIDVYRTPTCESSGFGEGREWLGATSTTTNAFGNALWSTTVTTTVPLGEFVTATATDPSGNTSEFSECRESGTQVADPAVAPPEEEQPPATETPFTPQQQAPQPSPTPTPTPPGPSCADKKAPITTLRKAGVKNDRRGAKLALSGRSADHRDCPSGVNRVDVSLARVAGRTGVNCRFIKRPNRTGLTKRQNCRRPVLFKATGTDRWTFTFPVRLPAGLYRVQARGTDKARNKETPKKNRNIVFFQVK